MTTGRLARGRSREGRKGIVDGETGITRLEFFLLPSIGYEPAEVHGLNKKKWQE
jgi:hypothetical protein